MSSDWPLRNITEITDSLNHKRVPLSGMDRQNRQGQFPYYGASGIVDYIDDYIFDGTYLLISEDGENLRSRNTPIAFKAHGKFWVNNHAHILDEKEEGILDYLEYYFSQLNLSPYITGAVQPKLNKGNLQKIDVRVPPLEQRLQINDILNGFTKKIHLNQQTNETLEAMAQAIFKSWFVDFDPVRAKIEATSVGRDPNRAAMATIAGISLEQDWDEIEAALDQKLARMSEAQKQQLSQTAQLFPDQLVESEIGMVPKGWGYQQAQKMADIGIGKTPPRKEKHWFSESDNDVKWVSIKDMGTYGIYALDTSEYLTREAIEEKNVRVVPDNTVILSFKMTIGRTAITIGEMTTNEAIAHFKLNARPELTAKYIFLYLSQFDFESLGSTSSIAKAINSKIIKKMPILVPDKELVDSFTQQVDPIFEKIKSNSLEVRTLSKLRDTLLPKLISGEITTQTIKS